MKKIALISINLYQSVFSVALKSIVGSPDVCRFSETCSNYTKRMIEEKGVFKGASLGLARISRCQPFAYNG